MFLVGDHEDRPYSQSVSFDIRISTARFATQPEKRHRIRDGAVGQQASKHHNELSILPYIGHQRRISPELRHSTEADWGRPVGQKDPDGSGQND